MEAKQRKLFKAINIIIVTAIAFFDNVITSAVTVIAYSIVYALRGVDLTDTESLMELMYSKPSILMFSSMYNLLAIGIVFLFWRYIDRQNVARLGFNRRSNTGKQIILGFAGALAAVAAIIFLGTISNIISYAGVGTNSFAASQIAVAALIGLITFLMVGFGEEAVYRSYIQNHLIDIAGNKLGLIISALIFTAVHLLTYGKLLDLLDVFLAGLILGYCFILTKSIYMPAFFHFMWDFLQTNIFRLQSYEYYKGPVLFIFNNTGDLIINNYNLGNKLEVIFIAVELIILIIMYLNRKSLSKLAEIN